MAKRKRTKITPEEQAAYDERTRLINEYLAKRGVPVGDDQASYDARTRRLEELLERHRARRAS
jgi:hypothetical protein